MSPEIHGRPHDERMAFDHGYRRRRRETMADAMVRPPRDYSPDDHVPEFHEDRSDRRFIKYVVTNALCLALLAFVYWLNR